MLGCMVWLVMYNKSHDMVTVVSLFCGDLLIIDKSYLRKCNFHEDSLLKCGLTNIISPWKPSWQTSPTIEIPEPCLVKYCFFFLQCKCKGKFYSSGNFSQFFTIIITPLITGNSPTRTTWAFINCAHMAPLHCKLIFSSQIPTNVGSLAAHVESYFKVSP